MEPLDWSWLRSFVEVADAGGVHAAAARTGLSQPTLSRHVRQLEDALQVALFERKGRSLTLSPQGEALVGHARAVRDAVSGLERRASGVSSEASGPVRVTLSWMLAVHFGAGWVAALRRDHPHISIDLVADDAAADLLLGEADIAVRQFRPAQLDLVLRRCGVLQQGFFASADYLRRRGTPSGLGELLQHDLIGYDRINAWIDEAGQLGFRMSRDSFVVRSDAPAVQASLAAAGVGIAVLALPMGHQHGLLRLLSETTVGAQSVFLTAHGDVLRNPRVAAVWRHLGEALAAYLAE